MGGSGGAGGLRRGHGGGGGGGGLFGGGGGSGAIYFESTDATAGGGGGGGGSSFGESTRPGVGTGDGEVTITHGDAAGPCEPDVEPKTAPVADAGDDQTVNPNYYVLLDGLGSMDPDSDPLTFSWIQTAGPAVIDLREASDPQIGLHAPPGPATLTFELTVCDLDMLCDSDTVTVTVNAQLTCENRVVTVNLADGQSPTNGPDVIRGTPDDDFIDGLGGDDSICGGGGGDVLRGNQGDDRVFGGDGNDVLRGNLGDDQIFGGDANDVLRGESGNDVLGGRAGDDHLVGQAGSDRLNGGRGRDLCQGGPGVDTAPRCETLAGVP